MIKALLTGIRRAIFWDFPRGSWQYDVLVIAILAFVFLTPREWFRDQPRVPQASHIARLPSGPGTDVFWIEATALESVAEADRPKAASELLRKKAGVNVKRPVRLEAVHSSEAELQGYLAFAGH